MVNLNTNIPLMGQGVNVLGNMAQGTQLASQQIAMQDAAQRKNLFAQHGAGLLSGDQNALNALAGVDPMAALQIRSQHQSMAISQERIAMAREQTRRALAEAEDQREAQREAQEAVTMGQRAMAAFQSGDERAWSMMTREFTGGTPLPMSREGVALLQSIVTGSADYMAMLPEQAKPQSSLGKFYADQSAGLIPAGAEMPSNAPVVNVNTGDQGKVVGTQGVIAVPDPTADGGYRFVIAENSPLDLERRDQASAQERAAASAASNEQTRQSVVLQTTKQIRDMLDRSGPLDLPEVGIIGSRLPNVNQEAADMRVMLDTIKGMVVFDRLEKLRQASATGASGLGQVTEREIALLGAQLGALDQSVSPARLRATLDTIDAVFGKLSPGALAYLEGAADALPSEVAQESQVEANPFAGVTQEQFRSIDLNQLSPEQIDQLFEAMNQ